MSATAGPTPEGEPVRVFDTQQESEAMVVHGLLTSAGIDSHVTNLGVDQALWPGVGGVVVLVSPEQAEAARRVIAEYNNTPTEIEAVDEEEAGE